MLTLVPTPIGNLQDITLRALTVLRETDFVIAENPLHTTKLFQAHSLPKKPFVQFAEHNELRVLPSLITRLLKDHGVLVTDAGTPGVSDPGFRLVRACIENGIAVDALPGPSAFLTALVASGLPTDKFFFVGFLPKTEPRLLRICEQAQGAEATLVAYESPQRLLKTLEILAKTHAEATIFVGRELTKLHQEYLRGSIVEVLQMCKSKTSVKGEIVLVISFK